MRNARRRTTHYADISELIKQGENKLAQKDAELAQKNAELAQNATALAEKDAVIARFQEQLKVLQK